LLTFLLDILPSDCTDYSNGVVAQTIGKQTGQGAKDAWSVSEQDLDLSGSGRFVFFCSNVRLG